MKLLPGYPSTDAFTAPLIHLFSNVKCLYDRGVLQLGKNAISTTSEDDPWSGAIWRESSIRFETLEVPLRAGDIGINET